MIVEIRQIGQCSITLGETTKKSLWNWIFILPVLVGFGIALLFNISSGIPLAIILIPILAGVIGLITLPFEYGAYWISDTCFGTSTADYVRKTGDETKDNIEICRLAQKREAEIQAIIDHEKKLEKMAENCKKQL